MPTRPSDEIIANWPKESQESAQAVVKQYGEPHETTDSELIWHNVGTWKRVVAQKAFWEHAFPAPHTDSVETFVDYPVPVEHFTNLARFDGSVMVERTSGEVSARCHDEQANRLALNLMYDIVTGRRSPEEARTYYATEFLDARRKKPTPYMDALNFEPVSDPSDSDTRILTDEQLQEAEREGRVSG